MPIRRYPAGSSPIFLTIVTHNRERHFADPTNQERFLAVMRKEREIRPFMMMAYVILPDHMHLMIRPEPGQEFVKIVGSVKANYSRRLRNALGVDAPVLLWQERFWDHIIHDEIDLAYHLDYIHYNPVRHGLVAKPELWKCTSFHEWKKRGRYGDMWGWALPDSLAAMTSAAGEIE